MAREAALADILAAREARAARQAALRDKYGMPLISFSLNIAGPVKDSPLIRRAFRAGAAELEAGLRAAGLPLLHREEVLAFTGCEGLYAVGGLPLEIKRVCVLIEEGSALGRLFDLDVLDREGRKLDREEAGAKERGCVVCGAAGRGCASRRVHSVDALQAAARRIMEDHFAAADRETVSALATRALLDEVCVTPKPGLVDRANSGSHRDMDVFTFTASAAALAPYWGECFQIGREVESPEDTLQVLKKAGLRAERRMFAATNGVNTHKGAIYTLGLLCGAVGRLWKPEAPCRGPEALLAMGGTLARAAAEAELAALTPETAWTAGQRLYLEQGLSGARGEAARGFPGVALALTALKNALSAGRSKNDAGAIALLSLIARGTDTNLAARGGQEGAEWAAARCRELLEWDSLPDMAEIAGIDREFIRKNLSPGGCADLLAAAFFLKSWEEAETYGADFPSE